MYLAHQLSYSSKTEMQKYLFLYIEHEIRIYLIILIDIFFSKLEDMEKKVRKWCTIVAHENKFESVDEVNVFQSGKQSHVELQHVN